MQVERLGSPKMFLRHWVVVTQVENCMKNLEIFTSPFITHHPTFLSIWFFFFLVAGRIGEIRSNGNCSANILWFGIVQSATSQFG